MMSLKQLEKQIIKCNTCPRLTAWRKRVAKEKVARFYEWDYWAKPVPGFGVKNAQVLIIGLAPAAHGANRTGRLFTGDRSGEWLYRALYKFGFASQPYSISRNDGLKLIDCYITAAIHCAPPANKPLKQELENCQRYLLQELQLLSNVRVIVALGKIAFETAIESFLTLQRTDLKNYPPFGHGKEYRLNERQTLIVSFHPSQQNTFTGKLTRPMFDKIFRRAKRLLC